MEGFLMLGRSMFRHHLWLEGRAFSRAEAWLDFLQIAAFEPHQRLVGGQEVDIPKGGIVASVRFLALRYRWSNTKVSLFLRALECEGMISRETRHGVTMIVLCNFEKYNPGKRRKDAERSEEPGKTRRCRPGSLSEVRMFCRAEGIHRADAEWYWDKGQGNGWKNAGAAIRDWKAVLRSWQKAGYLPTQRHGRAQPGKGGAVRDRTTVLRESAARYGGAFGAWVRGNYEKFPPGGDEICRTTEAMLTAFLRGKGERA